MKFLTTNQAAETLGLVPPAVAALCRQKGGPFPGALQPWGEGRGWLIPSAEVQRRLKNREKGRIHPGGRPRKSIPA